MTARVRVTAPERDQGDAGLLAVSSTRALLITRSWKGLLNGTE